MRISDANLSEHGVCRSTIESMRGWSARAVDKPTCMAFVGCH